MSGILLCIPLSLEIRMLLSSGCREGTSHMKVFMAYFRKEGLREEGKVSFLLPPFSQTPSTADIHCARCHIGEECFLLHHSPSEPSADMATSFSPRLLLFTRDSQTVMGCFVLCSLLSQPNVSTEVWVQQNTSLY